MCARDGGSSGGCTVVLHSGLRLPAQHSRGANQLPQRAQHLFAIRLNFMEKLSASLRHPAHSAQPGIGRKLPRVGDNGQFMRGVNGPGCGQSLGFTLKNYWKGFQPSRQAIGFSMDSRN